MKIQNVKIQNIEIKRPLNLNKRLLEDYSDYNYTKLNESGYSRIWEHCSNGFFILSAYLVEKQFETLEIDDISLEEYNEIATTELKKDLRQLGYGFIEQKGYYKSTLSEISFFVPFNSIDDRADKKAFNDAIDLMIKYHQESILIYDKYADDSGIYYLYQNGNVEYAGVFHKIEDIEKYMSIIKGKETGYTFESIGIRTLKGHGSLCPYYQYLRDGYIPISSDFEKLGRRIFANIKKDNKNIKNS